MFPAMPIIHVVQGAQRDAKVGSRMAGALRRTAVVVGAVGLTGGAGLLSAGSALASNNGSQPGKLTLHPASGPSKLRPTWSTKDGCPVGYQASAEMSEFNANGSFASRISVTVNKPVAAFSGSLDGNMSALLSLGSTVKPGQTSEWAIGCYSQIAGTGKVKWVQSTFVTLSTDGKTFTTSSGNGQAPPASTSGSGSGQGTSATSTNSGGSSSQLETAAIAGACGLIVAFGGLAFYRRRQRSRA
jgi:hypothetical protein